MTHYAERNFANTFMQKLGNSSTFQNVYICRIQDNTTNVRENRKTCRRVFGQQLKLHMLYKRASSFLAKKKADGRPRFQVITLKINKMS